MDEIATSDRDAFDAESLAETDSNILEQVRKDLSVEYIRFVSRVMKERLGAQAGGSESVSGQPPNAASRPPAANASS